MKFDSVKCFEVFYPCKVFALIWWNFFNKSLTVTFFSKSDHTIGFDLKFAINLTKNFLRPTVLSYQSLLNLLYRCFHFIDLFFSFSNFFCSLNFHWSCPSYQSSTFSPHWSGFLPFQVKCSSFCTTCNVSPTSTLFPSLSPFSPRFYFVLPLPPHFLHFHPLSLTSTQFPLLPPSFLHFHPCCLSDSFLMKHAPGFTFFPCAFYGSLCLPCHSLCHQMCHFLYRSIVVRSQVLRI